jgi:hypothetical protein
MGGKECIATYMTSQKIIPLHIPVSLLLNHFSYHFFLHTVGDSYAEVNLQMWKQCKEEEEGKLSACPFIILACTLSVVDSGLFNILSCSSYHINEETKSLFKFNVLCFTLY